TLQRAPPPPPTHLWEHIDLAVGLARAGRTDQATAALKRPRLRLPPDPGRGGAAPCCDRPGHLALRVGCQRTAAGHPRRRPAHVVPAPTRQGREPAGAAGRDPLRLPRRGRAVLLARGGAVPLADPP